MEYKPAFQFKNVFKNAKFGQCGPHLLWADPMRRSDCNLSLKEINIQPQLMHFFLKSLYIIQMFCKKFAKFTSFCSQNKLQIKCLYCWEWHFGVLVFKIFRGRILPDLPHRSHLQRSYVQPPNFWFVPKPLYYELYCTGYCIKWAFKTWKYQFKFSKF